VAKIIRFDTARGEYGRCECGSDLMRLVVDPPGSWTVVAIQCSGCGEFVAVDFEDEEDEIMCLIDEADL